MANNTSPPSEIVQKLPGPEKPRPIVIVGAGGIVRDAHLPAYSKAGFPVAGIFDLQTSRAHGLAQHFGLPRVYRALEEAAEEAPADSVFDVAVPASAILDVLPHLPDRAIVLIQKPLGENLQQARRIQALCRQKQLKAAVNFQLRFAPLALAARSLISDGHLGPIHEMDFRVVVYTPWHLWTFLEGLPRVEILYHSIHYLDLIRSFLGEPKSVSALTLRHSRAPKLSNTRSSILLNYGDSIRAQVMTNHGHDFGLHHQEASVGWEGERGAIKATMGVLMDYPTGMPDRFEYCLLSEKSRPKWIELPLHGQWFPDAFIGSMASLMRFAEGSSDNLATSVDDAYRTMALVEACYQSSESDGTAAYLTQSSE